MVGDIMVDEASRTTSVTEDAEDDKKCIVIRGVVEVEFRRKSFRSFAGWYSRLVDNGLQPVMEHNH